MTTVIQMTTTDINFHKLPTCVKYGQSLQRSRCLKNIFSLNTPYTNREYKDTYTDGGVYLETLFMLM